ncbi:MAG: hypothetical protein EPO64_03395 [Nitrospirae bacterium]|nr:MAG: hypothetical protein EPO64_03395 [Nitrospirota bacterium]
MKRSMRWFSGLVSLILLPMAGCAGTGEVVPLDLRAIPPVVGQEVQQGESATFLVMPFEDQRPQKNPVGLRTHFWGGVTYFDVPGGKPGDVLPHVLAEYLKQKGWQAEVGQTGKAGASDVTLTGQVQEFTAHAKSRFGSTVITVALKVALQARNAADRSTTKMTLEGTRMQTVFWFEPQDVQDLVAATLTEGLTKLMADAKVEGRSLRLK